MADTAAITVVMAVGAIEIPGMTESAY
jgi:hypothetical protein